MTVQFESLYASHFVCFSLCGSGPCTSNPPLDKHCTVGLPTARTIVYCLKIRQVFIHYSWAMCLTSWSRLWYSD